MTRRFYMLESGRSLAFALGAALAVLFAAQARAQDKAFEEEIDRSIDNGLAYLASVQLSDGAFPGTHGKGGAISALAGMAFLAKGHVPGADQYGVCINKSIDYILGLPDEKGYFGTVQEGNGKMYAHSICTLFLSEVSGMVDAPRQARLDDVLPKAVKILLDAQNVKKNARDTGGWRYAQTSSDSDMSCSGWALMALRSCRLNGGRVPSDAIERAVAYVKRHHNAGQGHFVYQQGNESYAVTLTGAGILCLELCGRHNDPDSLRAARYLLRVYRELENQNNAYYGMYYTSQGLFQIGGEGWQVFSNWMYRTWIPKQGGDGGWGGHEVSRPYCTSLMILAFTVPYRQLPIYQRDETVDED
ncbi:MAG: prenyltransferase [Kiritimatiellia bacterium]|jgi:hypothetical protein